MFNINDIDIETYQINMRNQGGHERPFWLSIPVPRNSKIKLKFTFSQFALAENYSGIKIKGFAYEDISYKANYSKHRQAAH